MRHLPAIVLAMVLPAAWTGASEAAADRGVALSLAAALPALDETKAIEAGRRSLDTWSGYPWYDAESDGVRRIDVQSTAPPAEPPPQADAASWPNFSLPAWLGSALAALLKILGYGIVLLILGAVVFLIARAFLARGRRLIKSNAEIEAIAPSNDADRLESLPFKLARPQSNLLAEARRQYEAGNYGEAIIFLFSYQLVELDKHQLIRLARGKTNRQYLREVWRMPVRGLLGQTMIAFEDFFFGNHPVSRERFEDCWSRLDEFHRMIAAA
jgi:hypothetical protein